MGLVMLGRQKYIEPLAPDLSVFQVDMAIKKKKRHNSPGIYQIPVELIKAGGRTFCCEIHKLINSIWNTEEVPEEWKELFIVLICKKGDKTDYGNYRGVLLMSTTCKIFIPHTAVKVNSICRGNY
jgi:hypothetical protein